LTAINPLYLYQSLSMFLDRLETSLHEVTVQSFCAFGFYCVYTERKKLLVGGRVERCLPLIGSGFDCKEGGPFVKDHVGSTATSETDGRRRQKRGERHEMRAAMRGRERGGRERQHCHFITAVIATSLRAEACFANPQKSALQPFNLFVPSSNSDGSSK